MSSISSQYFSSVVSILEKMGLNADVLLTAVEVSREDLKNPKFRVELDTLAKTFEIGKDALNEPNIGLEVCYRFRIATFTDTGSILAHCSSLAEAAEMNARYARLVETVGVSSLERRDDSVILLWDENFEDHEYYRHITELIVGGYVLTTNWLAWAFQKGAKSLHFKHKAPENLSRYQGIFKCPVSFGQDENKMAFHVDVVDKHLPTANPEKLNRYKEVLNGHLASYKAQSAFRMDVSVVIDDIMRTGKLSLPNVARTMNMSERSLRRKLLSEGITYRELVDNVRRNVCDSYMKDNVSFTEIAQILGYSDQSAFTRAFRKWHGMAPSEYKPNKFSM